MATSAAQITICGELRPATIAALVELALEAGVALLVQPRQAAAEAPPSRRLAGDVVEAPAALVRSPRAQPHPMQAAKSRLRAADADEARQRLATGSLGVQAFLGASGMSRYRAQKLVDAGVIVAIGSTSDRRYALPGKRAKEAP